MSHSIVSSHQVSLTEEYADPGLEAGGKNLERDSSARLAASITKAASIQTYLTIRYLVDGPLVDDAFRAYAYFRWVDDAIDNGQMSQAERAAFLTRQQNIVDQCFRGEYSNAFSPEETMVVDLIKREQVRGDQVEYNGLRSYIDHMMDVMVIDANRKDRLINKMELDEYTRSLAIAVTEALHYFIGHNDYSPTDETRYSAVTGAHITHMLRDAIEDAEIGYFNIPKETIENYGISPADIKQDAYRKWVAEQVVLARRCFAVGRASMARVQNLRCRLAGYAYIARFEVVLEAIERESYLLRADYPERKTKKTRLKMALSSIVQTLNSSLRGHHKTRSRIMPSMETVK